MRVSKLDKYSRRPDGGQEKLYSAGGDTGAIPLAPISKPQATIKL
tara:strand:- start:212 stop:346 length:135 start_codon:yes stop_codon:yes gene_type:complete